MQTSSPNRSIHSSAMYYCTNVGTVPRESAAHDLANRPGPLSERRIIPINKRVPEVWPGDRGPILASSKVAITPVEAHKPSVKVSIQFARPLIPAALFALLLVMLLSGLSIHYPDHGVSPLNPITSALGLPGYDICKPDGEEGQASHTSASIIIPFEQSTAAINHYPAPVPSWVFAASLARAPPQS